MEMSPCPRFRLFQAGDLTLAVNDFGTALSREPRNAWALFGRGLAQQRTEGLLSETDDIKAARDILFNVADGVAEPYGVR